jgi:hypothetical protein
MGGLNLSESGKLHIKARLENKQNGGGGEEFPAKESTVRNHKKKSIYKYEPEITYSSQFHYEK